MGKQSEMNLVENAVKSFEESTPNESRFDHQGVVKVSAVIDIRNISEKFETEFPFEIKNQGEFDFQVKSFTKDFLVNHLAILGFRVPDVIHLDELEIIAADKEKLEEIGYIVFKIEDFESDLAPEYLQDKFINNFLDDFYDARGIFLLTQRIISTCKRKAAA